MDDTNALSAEESKYFETGGQADLPLVEEKAPETVEKPEPEKQPEAKKEAPPEIEVVDDDDGTGEPDARKYVKVGVLRKEREKAKEFRAQLNQTQQQMAALQRQIEAAKNPPRELAPEEVPHVALQRVQQLEESLANTAAKQQFLASYQRLASDFAKEQADFADAYKHALGVRRTMYEDAGYAPEQVNLLLESEEAAIVERAMMNGENPAAKLYKIAQTLGYKPAAKEEPKPGKTEADKVVLAAEKLAQIQKGMEKNKSVSGGGGADSAPSLAELAEMDDAEFDKATSGENWKKMMGG
jgi:DNA repair exonuclease SbcCD ATPase subunit